jgi:hypothetical protein
MPSVTCSHTYIYLRTKFIDRMDEICSRHGRCNKYILHTDLRWMDHVRNAGYDVMRVVIIYIGHLVLLRYWAVY